MMGGSLAEQMASETVRNTQRYQPPANPEKDLMGNNGSFNYGPIGKDNYMTRNNARDNIVKMADYSSKLTGNYNSKKRDNVVSMMYDSMRKVA